MSDPYLWLKLAHVLSAAVLFGTGMGIAFFMVCAHLTREAATVARVAAMVVWADFLFTAVAVAVQPATGVAMILIAGWGPWESWLVAAYVLYVFTGLCWLPVVRLQIRARDLARAAVAAGTALPPEYARTFRAWFVLGWPAFAAVLATYWLMLAKPVLW